MKSEVDRLRFGLDGLAPKLPAPDAGDAGSGGDSQELAAVPGRLGTPVVRNGSSTQKEAGTPSAFALEVPASLLAGCRGLEPLASGVTVDPQWMAGARPGSQHAANAANPLDRSSPFSQRFAALFRPFGTSLVQSSAVDAESVRWVSVRELAAMLRVSTSTVYQAVAAGEIPHVRVSNAIRIPVGSAKL
jgi:excisionase family DNA binding protein